jgi:hypothetical protein
LTFHYQHRLGHDITQVGIYNEEDVSSEILDIIQTDDNFKESRNFGKKELGDSEEYESLIIAGDGYKNHFQYHNKGIYYMVRGTEADKPVFQVFTFFLPPPSPTQGGRSYVTGKIVDARQIELPGDPKLAEGTIERSAPSGTFF